MGANNTTNEEQVDDVNSSSVDNFIKELEAKEKDLHISSDLVIEIDDSDVEHDNIHDSFIAPFSSAEDLQESYSKRKEESRGDSRQGNSLDTFQKQFDKLRDERDDLKEALIRRKRDFENYRMRTERERGEAFRNLVSNVASQTLPVLDNLSRALDAFSTADSDESKKDFQTFLEGIVLVNQQLNEVLASMGVQPIPAVGKPFDPNFHEAVETVETDEVPPRTVMSEILRGYRVDDRVIRASLVKVSSPKAAEPDSKDTGKE